MKLNPRFCIESGDLFSFQRGENPEAAAGHHIFAIMQLKDATLGEEIVVKKDYRGKRFAKFTTTEMEAITKWPSDMLRYRQIDGRIIFAKVPIPRSSKPGKWQGIYRIGTPMFKTEGGLWLQRAIRTNPVYQD